MSWARVPPDATFNGFVYICGEIGLLTFGFEGVLKVVTLGGTEVEYE